jgi:hypothetical protein
VHVFDEVVVGFAKGAFLAEVVGVEEGEEEDGDQGNPNEVDFAFVSDEDEEGGGEGDTPGFAVAAVGGHAADDALEDIKVALDSAGFGVKGIGNGWRLFGYFLKNMEKGWFFAGNYCGWEVFVMGEGGEIGEMGGVVVSEN